MNIAITNRCSRRCEFCFQKDWFLESPERKLEEMSPDMFRLVTMHMKSGGYSLLGGEPLMHSKIDEILDFCQNCNIGISMLSNISVDHSLFSNIINKYSKIISGWLINSDYPEEQRDLFMKNLVTLIDYQLSRKINFTLGTTLVPREGAIDEAIERLSYIMKRVPKSVIPSLRLSATTPTHNKVFKMYDYTKDVEKLVLTLRKINEDLFFYFDCSPLGCMISSDFTGQYIDVIKRKPRICTNPIPDIMPDGRVYWCSSATFLTVPNVLDYNSEQELTEELQRQWKEYWMTASFSKKCRDCRELKPGACYGYCAAVDYAIYHDHCEC